MKIQYMETYYQGDKLYPGFALAKEQEFCCEEAKNNAFIFDFRIRGPKGRNEVMLIGLRDAFDCNEEIELHYCPFCGKKFTFKNIGKYAKFVEKKENKTFFEEVSYRKME